MSNVSGTVTKLLFTLAISAGSAVPAYGVNPPHRTSLSSNSSVGLAASSASIFLGFVTKKILNPNDLASKFQCSVRFLADFKVLDINMGCGSTDCAFRRVADNGSTLMGNIQRITDARFFSDDASRLVYKNGSEQVERELSRILADSLHLDLISKVAACGDECR